MDELTISFAGTSANMRSAICTYCRVWVSQHPYWSRLPCSVTSIDNATYLAPPHFFSSYHLRPFLQLESTIMAVENMITHPSALGSQHCRFVYLLHNLSSHVPPPCEIPWSQTCSYHEVLWWILRPPSRPLICENPPETSRPIW